ncbi:ALF repeat-containing protein [Streptomyces sp. NPDC000410]|uniref:ALF repeat-containing protein n=1 Tax=Streptomyces sp. NPDC000410 TaxID=3154254 RepID=UPI0033296A83
MRMTRALLVVATTALAPVLLLSAPAAAATGPIGSLAVCGVATPGAGGTSTPVDEMSDLDVRVEIFNILGDPGTGKAVDEAAQAALNGTIEDQRNFLKTGWKAAQEADNHAAVFCILGIAKSNGDRAVVEAANKALQAGTADAVRAFLETGYRLAQLDDDRFAIFCLLGDPTTSTELREAANRALSDGTPEALRSFREQANF